MKKRKILGWVCVIWGGLILLNGLPVLFRPPTGSAYGMGQLSATLFGAFMLFVGVRELRKKVVPENPAPSPPPK